MPKNMPNTNKVLVVDDAPTVLLLLERCLTSVGFQVVQASNGYKALEQLETGEYGVVILDLKMPGMSGLEVLGIIQQRWPHIKVIILTANASLEVAVETLRKGAYDFIIKPLSVKHLQAVVRHAANKLRLELCLVAVHDMSQEVGLSQDLDQVVAKIFEIVGRVLEFGVCNLFLLDQEQNTLVLYDATYGQANTSALCLSLEDDTSVVVAAAQSRAPVYVPDFANEPAFYCATCDDNQRSELSVPMLVRGDVIGVLDMTSPGNNAFSPDEIQLLSTLASQAAVAIENARLYEQTSRNLAEWRLLGEVLLAATSTLDFGEILTQVLSAIYRMLPFEHLNFVLPCEDGEQHLVIHPSFIGGTPSSGEKPFRIDGSLEGQVYSTGYPMYVGYTKNPARRTSQLAVPVRASGEVVAILNIESTRPNAFNDDDLRIFQTTADQLGVVLENVRFYETERELRKLVEQSHAKLVQSEKLAATGRMAASLAHEINNPLQAIHNSLQFVLNFSISADEQREYLQMTNEEVERLMGMTGRILEFARPAKQSMQPIDLNEPIANVLTLTDKFMQHNSIMLHETLSSNLPRVAAAKGELEHIFLNLVMNAVEAMPYGGDLYVCSRVADNDGVEFVITDTGYGIDPEHIDHIFELFFSTKEGGTGLGLALNHSIIQYHGGEINVHSEKGKGATFTIWLPALNADG